MDATTTALQGRKRGNMCTEKNCQSCKYYKDGYCENLELKPCYPQKGCDDFSKRSELKEDAMQILEAYMRLDVIGFFDVKDAIKDLIEWSKNAYKQGWHDAIEQALKETHSILTEEGHFRVVQEETLIGVVMAYEQVSTERQGSGKRDWEIAEQFVRFVMHSIFQSTKISARTVGRRWR